MSQRCNREESVWGKVKGAVWVEGVQGKGEGWLTMGFMAYMGQGSPLWRFRMRMGVPSTSHTICRALHLMVYVWNAAEGSKVRLYCREDTERRKKKRYHISCWHRPQDLPAAPLNGVRVECRGVESETELQGGHRKKRKKKHG